MNPKLAWDEAQAKMQDLRREAEFRRLTGEAHRACQVCGLDNRPNAAHCENCGHKLPPPPDRSSGPTES